MRCRSLYRWHGRDGCLMQVMAAKGKWLAVLEQIEISRNALREQPEVFERLFRDATRKWALRSCMRGGPTKAWHCSRGLERKVRAERGAPEAIAQPRWQAGSGPGAKDAKRTFQYSDVASRVSAIRDAVDAGGTRAGQRPNIC